MGSRTWIPLKLPVGALYTLIFINILYIIILHRYCWFWKCCLRLFRLIDGRIVLIQLNSTYNIIVLALKYSNYYLLQRLYLQFVWQSWDWSTLSCSQGVYHNITHFGPEYYFLVYWFFMSWNSSVIINTTDYITLLSIHYHSNINNNYKDKIEWLFHNTKEIRRMTKVYAFLLNILQNSSYNHSDNDFNN